MFLMEYDYKDDIASQREESFEEGRVEGLEEGLEKGRLESMRLMMQKLSMSLPQVMETLNIPPEERGKYASLLS
jgi:flagellar biosynthesis/type III secretory pathway protein FliH